MPLTAKLMEGFAFAFEAAAALPLEGTYAESILSTVKLEHTKLRMFCQHLLDTRKVNIQKADIK